MDKRLSVLPVLALLTGMSFTACDKKPEHINPQQPLDTVSIRLKEMVVSNLPSPHYKFQYNNERFVTALEHSSGLVKYELEYANGRLRKMTEKMFGDSLIYSYSGSNVSAIDVYSGITGKREWHHEFTYNQQRKLLKAEWFVIAGTGTNLIRERKMEFMYRSDGNLAHYTDYFADVNGEYGPYTVVAFDQYDDKINVDDFDLLKYNFGHVVYLPGIRLQNNNPRYRHQENAVNEFEITYSYTYNDRLPMVKTTTVKKLRGDNAGLTTTGNTTYSYF